MSTVTLYLRQRGLPPGSPSLARGNGGSVFPECEQASARGRRNLVFDSIGGQTHTRVPRPPRLGRVIVQGRQAHIIRRRHSGRPRAFRATPLPNRGAAGGTPVRPYPPAPRRKPRRDREL